MAKQSPPRGNRALMGLSTSINLLYFRAGNGLSPKWPQVVEIDDEDDPCNIDPSACTARPDELSQGSDHLRQRFLNRLSELFAAERNGRYVTAAAFSEEEREAHIHIWLARNNGFKDNTEYRGIERAGMELKNGEMIDSIELALNQLAGKKSKGARGNGTDIWNLMIRYSSPRLRFYRRNLATLLYPRRMQLESMLEESAAAIDSQIGRIWKDICSLLFGLQLHKTELDDLKDLVRIGAAARQAIHAGDDLTTPLGGPNWARKAVATLCLAGKLSSAYDTIKIATTTIWQGYTFTVFPLLYATAPAQMPKCKLGLASSLKRLNIPVTDPIWKEYMSNPRAEDMFATLQKNELYIHAEVQLLFHLARYNISNVYPYIGTSKLPCVLCTVFLGAEGTFACRESHKHLYPKWIVPKMTGLPRDVEQRMWKAIDRMKETLRMNIVSPREEGRELRPESTVDMTVKSGITAEGNATLSSEVALHLQRQRAVHEQDVLSGILSSQLPKSSNSHLEPEASGSDNANFPMSSQHIETLADMLENEFDRCPRSTSRRCGRCGQDRFCSEFCESRMTVAHKFTCSNGPLTTADYLRRDCAQDELPADPSVLEDFGFEQLLSLNDRSKLLGLYQRLFLIGITAEELHDWRIHGKLVDKTINSFETLPTHCRGGYFPWFLKNRRAIFPSTPRANGQNDIKRLFQQTKFLLEPSERTKPVSELQPESKRKSFILATILATRAHPPPEFVGPYWDFGFCACVDEAEEGVLGGLYQQLILSDARIPRQLDWEEAIQSPASVTRFSEFWQAFSDGSLLQLMDRSGLKSERTKIRFLESYLSSSSESRDLSVWSLLTFLKTSGDELKEPPPMIVFVDFKFILCSNRLQTMELKRLYITLLAKADIMQLQRAQNTSRLLEFVQQYVELTPTIASILTLRLID